MTVAAPAISSEVEPAIEQPRHHIPALIVGAQKIISELPGGADRRVAQSQTFGRLLHHRNVLAVDVNDGIKAWSGKDRRPAHAA